MAPFQPSDGHFAGASLHPSEGHAGAIAGELGAGLWLMVFTMYTCFSGTVCPFPLLGPAPEKKGGVSASRPAAWSMLAVLTVYTCSSLPDVCQLLSLDACQPSLLAAACQPLELAPCHPVLGAICQPLPFGFFIGQPEFRKSCTLPVVYHASMTSIFLGLLLVGALAAAQPALALDLLDSAGFLWDLSFVFLTSKRSVALPWPFLPLFRICQASVEPGYFHLAVAGAFWDLWDEDAEGFV